MTENEILTQMENLVSQLNAATVAYDAGYPTMSDKEWDDLYFKLVQLEFGAGMSLKNSPTQKVNWEPVSKLEKRTHNHPMLSLAKTKSIEELESFMGTKSVIFMAKMDGLTCSLTYRNGRLVSAETRGDGTIGEDITHNATVAITNLPLNIPEQDEVIVDGEIICDYKTFENFKDDFANPRNFAAGGIRCLDPMECCAKGLSFIAWDCIKGASSVMDKLSSKLHWLEYLGFETVPFLLRHPEPNAFLHYTDKCIDAIKSQAQEWGFPIDGVVVKYDDTEYYESLGKTAHHFNGGIAFKFYDEEYETKLLDITYDVSRMGVLTPVAIVEPIEIDGTIVERCSMSNLSVMFDTLGEYPELYESVWITKRNQIIPHIERANRNDTLHDHVIDNAHLTYCPICGELTVVNTSSSGVKTLMCGNDNCSGKIINKLDHFCGKKGLDIKGISKATIGKLLDWRYVEDERDIFTLDRFRNEWTKKAGFGVKSVDKILDAIEQGRRTDLWKFISALGIPLIGSTYAKEIAKQLGTWEAFREAVDNKDTDFSTLEGFGPEMNYALKHFNYGNADYLIEEELIILNNNNSNDLPNNSSDSNNKLDGLTFVITGKIQSWKNRDELKAAIEARGGKVSGSVSAKTSYLINNDTTSTTAKNKSAQQLGIPIISEEEFKSLFDF